MGPSTIHSPGRARAASRRTTACTSAIERAWSSDGTRSRRPSRSMWAWASTNPGSTVRPRRSTRTVRGPASASTVASSPTATMRSPRTASAWAHENARSTVSTWPPWSTRSGGADGTGARLMRSQLQRAAYNLTSARVEVIHGRGTLAHLATPAFHYSIRPGARCAGGAGRPAAGRVRGAGRGAEAERARGHERPGRGGDERAGRPGGGFYAARRADAAAGASDGAGGADAVGERHGLLCRHRAGLLRRAGDHGGDHADPVGGDDARAAGGGPDRRGRDDADARVHERHRPGRAHLGRSRQGQHAAGLWLPGPGASPRGLGQRDDPQRGGPARQEGVRAVARLGRAGVAR